MHILINRRELFASASAFAVVAALPAAAVAAASIVSAPALPAFIVGTPGEYDWQHIVAETAEQAFKEWAAENDYDDPPREFDQDCVRRVPEFDGIADSTPAMWLNAGLGHICDRCGYETHPDMGGRAIEDAAVCEECITLLDKVQHDSEEAYDDIANRLYDDGPEDTQAWLENEKVWHLVKDDLWPRAVVDVAANKP